MSIDELIAELEKLREEHGGDIPVFFEDDEYGNFKVVTVRFEAGIILLSELENYDGAANEH